MPVVPAEEHCRQKDQEFKAHPELLNKHKVNQRYMTPHLKKMEGKGTFNLLAFKDGRLRILYRPY